MCFIHLIFITNNYWKIIGMSNRLKPYNRLFDQVSNRKKGTAGFNDTSVFFLSFHYFKVLYFNYNCKDSVIYKFIIYNTLQIIYIPGYVMSHSWLLFGHCGTEFLLRKIIWSMQDDESVAKLRNNQTCCREDSFRWNRCWQNS